MPALMIQAPDQASPALHAALYAEWQKFRDGTAPVDPEYIPPVSYTHLTLPTT